MRTAATINEARKASKRGRKQAIIEMSEYTSFLTTATGMSRRGDKEMMILFAKKHPEVLT